MKNQDTNKTDYNAPSTEAIEKIEDLLKSTEDTNIDLGFALMQEQGIEPKQVSYVVEMLSLNVWLNRYDKGFSGDAIEVIRGLTSLEELSLENNQLTDLPQSIGNLTALNTLHLHNNQLTELPQSIGNLTSLAVLNLHNNQLTELPQSIGNLTALEAMYLYNNQLKDLPQSIGNLAALRWLYLWNNELSESNIKSIKLALPSLYNQI